MTQDIGKDIIKGNVKEKIMRLDKFLKISRVIKRRTVANEAADSGRISVNRESGETEL